MEWLKKIFEKHSKEDGTVDLEAAYKEVKTEMPKHETPKEEFNAKIEELRLANEAIKARDKQIIDLQKVDPEKLQEEIEKLNKENKEAVKAHQAEINKIKIENLLTAKLGEFKVRSAKAVKAYLDMNKIKLDGDVLIGIDDQLNDLAKSEETGFMFGGDSSGSDYKPEDSNVDTPPGNDGVNIGELFAKQHYAQYEQAGEQN